MSLLPMVVLWLGISFLFFAPSPVFALLTITKVSPTTINSPEDTITLSASASGLSNSVQYLQAVFTKEGSGTNYLGLTKNASEEWYPYKSSPTSVDLSTYFYSFTPTNASWSGDLQARIDTTDDGFSGPGNYLLKLIKYISSSGSSSNNSVTVEVKIALPNVQASTSAQTTTVLSPAITLDVGGSYQLGEVFTINLKLENFDQEREHYMKFRAGQVGGDLNKGQTQNGTAFFADNENWNSFPIIKTDSGGKWEGKIYGRIGEDKPEGQYLIRTRIRKKDTETFYDSQDKTITFSKPPEEEIKEEEKSSPSGSKQSSTESSSIIKFSNDDDQNNRDLVLGTSSAQSEQDPPAAKTSPETNGKPLAMLLFIISGAGLLGLAFYIKKAF